MVELWKVTYEIIAHFQSFAESTELSSRSHNLAKFDIEHTLFIQIFLLFNCFRQNGFHGATLQLQNLQNKIMHFKSTKLASYLGDMWVKQEYFSRLEEPLGLGAAAGRRGPGWCSYGPQNVTPKGGAQG